MIVEGLLVSFVPVLDVPDGQSQRVFKRVVDVIEQVDAHVIVEGLLRSVQVLGHISLLEVEVQPFWLGGSRQLYSNENKRDTYLEIVL